MKSAKKSCSRVLRTPQMCVGALILIALASLSACSNAAPASSNGKAKDAQRQIRLLAEIDQLIGDAKCSSDQQCKVAGIGALSCGGPESYRAWSTASTDEKKMARLLDAYATERRRFNEAIGLMSTCEVKPVPAARCEGAGTASAQCTLSGLASDLR